ncbi:2Fe-2S iron-sulfur cluster-binding protein [Geothermobacter hydrogeniphilus]|uniref:Ferredoxin-NADP reductase n=1 Tax=Geothermobacter hydrogeniphilus TaxID=1969733 RepID=A0A1X0Y8Q5_9BACT|nr:2Fe-2S iron-sulfur cluster-binding protein [Geothermobacter hydrogeniphilus]ORJ61506.1 hypothetical protein B5V00_05565 [Geothermobacter hydrogeniphilus]
MSSPLSVPAPVMLISHLIRVLLPVLVMLLILSAPALAQTSAAEHRSHHPGAATPEAADAGMSMGMDGKGKKGGGMGGGMGGGGMKEMMKAMARPKSTELFPTLIRLPQLSTEQRATLLKRARQREAEGIAQLHKGVGAFTRAQGQDDQAAMLAEAEAIDEGLTRFRSGLAVRRALSEGTSPPRVALQWYKSQLNLLPPATMRPGFQLFGMPPFSLFICLFSLLVGATLVLIYLAKVRRTSELLARLTTEGAGPTAPAEPTRHTVTPVPESAENDSASAATVPLPEQGGMNLKKGKLCRLRVIRIYQETPEVKTFRMVACDGSAIPFSYQPGQFLTVTIPHGQTTIKRNYTISSSPTQGYYCEITVKREEQGIGSRYLHDVLKEGDTLEVQPPSGRFIFTGREAESIVLIGGGVGVTPMISVVRAMLDIGWGGELYFIYACRSPEEFIFADEMTLLKQRNPNLKSFIVVSEPGDAKGDFYPGMLNAERLAEWVPDISSKRIHLCGSPPMMAALKTMLADLGVPKEQVKFELFGPPSSGAGGQTGAVEDNPADPADAPILSFKSSGKSIRMQAGESVLEAAGRAGVEIDSSCLAGSCGMCAVKLLDGKVDMANDDGLHPDDKARGFILACQAKARTDLTIEA